MINNSGYVGYSRSVRSKEAIEDYEIPLTMIKKALIEEFLEEHRTDFEENDYIFLSKLPVNRWKYISQKVEPTSWHHTGKYYNKTNHYKLVDIALKLLEVKDTLEKDYKNFVDSKKQKKKDFKYGVIKVQIWGGTRRYPKIEGYEMEGGIIIGDWLHYLAGKKINKYKVTANKTEWFKKFDSYSDLVKNFPEYKGKVKIFNKIVKEVVKC